MFFTHIDNLLIISLFFSLSHIRNVNRYLIFIKLIFIKKIKR